MDSRRPWSYAVAQLRVVTVVVRHLVLVRALDALVARVRVSTDTLHDDRGHHAIATLKTAGAEVVDVTIPTWGKWDDDELTVLLYEFKDGINTYLQQAGTAVSSLDALIAWNQMHDAQVMPPMPISMAVRGAVSVFMVQA